MRGRTLQAAGGSLLKHRSVRRAAFLLYDTIAISASLIIATMLRMNGVIPPSMWQGLVASLPLSVISGLAIFYGFGVYTRVWRLASLADLMALIEAAAFAILVSVILLVLTAHTQWMPTSVPFIQWLVLGALLAGGRVWRRVLRDWRRAIAMKAGAARNLVPQGACQRALVAGLAEDVEVVLRQIEAAKDPNLFAVGILDAGDQDVAMRLRHVPILGRVDAVKHVVGQLAARNMRPTCLILAEGANGMAGAERLRLITAAETLDLAVLRAAPPAALDQALDLKSVNLADLLGRPQAVLDERVVHRALKDRRVLVTGAGGTIGRELAAQIAAIGPAELMLLDAGEYNLYLVEMELRENFPQVACTPLLCSIRQRQHVMAVFERHRPEFVFHAAALKHVPLVETNACAGVQTNVLGTRNVADAARRFGVRAMVQVSTDKAVNPVGVMGATKRLGELYGQALDLEGVGDPAAARFMTVRFGNVLGSSGSLIPLFERQLKRRAPLTVTHPEITRYFMTVHEAVQLVLHSMARALECDVKRGRLIVLDMGEPVKVIDIARRMIRLAGLEPHRDVPIEIVGLRPGEKLYEELFDAREERLPSELPGVFEAEPMPIPLSVLRDGFDALSDAIAAHDEASVKALLFGMLDIGREDEPAAPQREAGAEARPAWATGSLATNSL